MVIIEISFILLFVYKKFVVHIYKSHQMKSSIEYVM